MSRMVKRKGCQAKPEEAEHPLKKWRRENRYSRPAFLKLLEEREGVKVSLRSLVYWEEGIFRPRDAEVVEAIRRVTG